MKKPFLVLFSWLVFHPASFGAELSVEDVRSQYRQARPRLEAIWQTPARYSFTHTVHRWDIPPEMAGKVRPDDSKRFEVYGQDGRWRFDMIMDLNGGGTANNIVVATNDRHYRATKKPGEQGYAVTDLGGQDRILSDTARTIAGLCEASFMLPTRLDVADILDGAEYRIKVIPASTPAGAGSKTAPVECEFESLAKTPVGGKTTRLKFETGRVTFRPDQNWAIDRFEMHANTGLHFIGHVEYQHVAGLEATTVPRRVEFDSTEDKSTLKTRDVLEAVQVQPGPIEDEVFDPTQFQPAAQATRAASQVVAQGLNVKQSDGWSGRTMLIGVGVLLIAIASVVRILATRRAAAAA